MHLSLIILIFVALYVLLHQDQPVAKGSLSVFEQNRSGDALETLRQRYARGEIDEAEYTERKNVLDLP